MPPRIDDEEEEIEIQEPALAPRRRRRRYAGRGCMPGCSPGCIVIILIFIGILVALFFITTGPKTIKEIPKDFPANIPLYKPQSLQKMVFLSATRKNRGLEFAAFFPKLILYPISRGLDLQSKKHFKEIAPYINIEPNVVDADHFLAFMKTPIGKQTNTLALVWKQLSADNSFLLNFYRDELTRSGYAISPVSASPDVSFFSFTSSDANGWVAVKPSGVDEYGTNEMILIVEYVPTF